MKRSTIDDYFESNTNSNKKTKNYACSNCIQNDLCCDGEDHCFNCELIGMECSNSNDILEMKEIKLINLIDQNENNEKKTIDQNNETIESNNCRDFQVHSSEELKAKNKILEDEEIPLFIKSNKIQTFTSEKERGKQINEIRSKFNSFNFKCVKDKDHSSQSTTVDEQQKVYQIFTYFPSIPQIFLPYLGMKAGSMYVWVSIEKNKEESYYIPENVVLDEMSEVLALSLGFPPTLFKNKKLSLLSPKYNDKEKQQYTKGLLSVCKQPVSYARVISYRKDIEGNTVVLDKLNAFYTENGKPYKSFAFIKDMHVYHKDEEPPELNSRFIDLN